MKKAHPKDGFFDNSGVRCDEEEPKGLDVHAPQALTRKRLVGNKATASALANEPSDLP